MLLARRTRQTPELLVGLGLLMAGGLWSPLMAVGRQATALSDAARIALVMIGGATGFVGMTCIAIFTWRVYRPSQPWAMTLSAGFSCFVAILYVAQSVGPGWLVF